MDELLNLDEDEKRKLYESLFCHARRKMNRLGWKGMFPQVGKKTPAGYGPRDVVHDIVEKFLFGKRKWNKEKYATIEKCLLSAIDSQINHMMTSLKKKPVKRLAITRDDGKRIQAYELPGREPEPIIIVEDQESATEFHEAVKQIISEEEVFKQIYECIEADITEPSEISDITGIDVKDINNAKKRLRRRLEKMDNQYLTAWRRAS